MIDAAALAVERDFDLLREKSGVQAQIDKAGAGHFGAVDFQAACKRVGYLLRQLTRVLLQRFGGAHHAVDLEIAELGAFGRLQNNRAAADAGLRKGGFDFCGNGLV